MESLLQSDSTLWERASLITIDFEGLGDLEAVTNQFAGDGAARASVVRFAPFGDPQERVRASDSHDTQSPRRNQ